jgi:tetratricopeptide (TPR) repeat protein
MVMGASCIRFLPAAALLGGYVTFASASAQASCEPLVGVLVSVSGTVEVQRASGDQWSLAPLNETLCEGDTIRVGERSRAAVSLINEAVLRIDQATTIRLLDITGEAGERSWLDLLNGAIQSFSRRPRLISVNTPYLNGSIEGTEFLMRVDDGATQITVIEGVVTAANDQGSVALSPGEAANASAGMAPERRIVVRPRDQVQWALYYPPVLSAAAVAGRSPDLARAAQCAADGDTQCAFAALDQVPASRRDANFQLLRASLLLSVGQIEPARAAIDEAIRSDPASGDAYALRSVIAVALNDQSEAVAGANRAVDLSPSSAAARIAQSYALQSALDLQGARETLEQAVEQNPQNALAWARLAELQLMLGERSASKAAAERAVALDPAISRTQIVVGFAALSEIRIRQAGEAFERAIALDSADPLPRLGLGLTKIRGGALADGRAELETAVALDSNQSLLRAYLGKAYFEEKRAPLDAQQFAIAEELDPLDPTAYLYDAIRLQTENRPVEALRQLEKSIELNDNRAVYRSRLLLDQDRAARGASLARIFSDLGFTETGIAAATNSLALDPSNASAHRFLSDTYSTVRRREVARVSELLQAQMLQDINIFPVQPSRSETNLNTITSGGPSSVGYNEFTPLFERNRVHLDLTALGGNNGTFGAEGVASAVYDWLSLSAGYYHYESDGWRPNNGLEQEIYNVYAQAAVTPELNLQAEFRRRDSTEGDLAFNFDPDDFVEDRTVDREQDSVRVGLRYSPSPASDLLLSYIHSDREDRLTETAPLAFPFDTVSTDLTIDTKGDQYEAQYLFTRGSLKLVVGAGYSDAEVREQTSLFFDSLLDPPGPPDFLDFSIDAVTDGNIEHARGYAYANVNISPAVVATLGVSYDDYQEAPVEETSVNPKFGVIWAVNQALTLRAAAFKVLKPALFNNRTLEPTQIAGFNQLFDDPSATKSTRYGLGLDWIARPGLTFGAELTWRDLEEPIIDFAGGAVFEDREEELHRAYVYWTPTDRMAATAEVVYDRYQSSGDITSETNIPELVRTVSVPVGLKYFLPNGLSAGIGGTYVDQRVRRYEFATQGEGEDSFFVVDASLAYLLPRRLGVLSLQVRNLFGEEFDYQDDSYREFRDEPSTGPYYPETTFWATARLSF